jgi:hypothetical protein
MKTGDEFQLLVLSAARKVDTAEIKRHLGVRSVRFATPEELETMLNFLKEKDTPSTGDPAGWVNMEMATVKDLAQYAYAPGPNGQPKLDPERVRKILSTMQGVPPEQVKVPPEAMDLTVDQARQIINEADTYYRHVADVWRSSYPGPASESTDVLGEQIIDRNPVAVTFMGSVERAYELMRRTEASRRVTQLIYNVELFKARNGRPPASLDELPAEQIAEIRTDPFSSKDFVYRLAESGPVIYSASANGRDDGGVHSPNWGDRDDETKSDDYVFWPPQVKDK